MRSTRAIRRLILIALGVLGAAAPASAQVEIGGMRVEGDIEAGPRFFIEEPSKSRQSKFLEYRDINQGLYLQDLHLRIFRPDESYSTELGGKLWGLQTQEYSLRAGRTGLWEFGFNWDQMRHIFSTNARMLADETSRGVFTLPATRPALALYNSARELDEISVRWDTAKIFFKLTPTPDIDVLAQYTRIRKDGDRPMGMAMGSPGNNFIEVLQPIEHTIHDFRLSGTVAREQWQAQFGYTLSIFQNDQGRIVADNPCFGAVAPVGCGADGGAAAQTRGQSSLAPDNMAHTFYAQGGVNLPLRTRLSGNFTYSLMLQNDSFLPHTINPAFDGNVDLVLPQKSLNGFVQTFLFNVNATSRPLPIPVTFSAKYRFYTLDDESDQPIFPGHVDNDRVFAGEARKAGRFNFTRHNGDLDARWQIIRPVAMTIGTGWEQWNRNEHREVPISDEFCGKAKLDVTPSDWLLIRTSYLPCFRRINRYNTRAHAEHTVVEDPAAASQGQSVLLRKFDESDRDRQKAELQLQITPIDSLSVTPTVGARWDDYIASTLGLQQENAWSAGIDLSWAPFERLSFFGGYMRELMYQKQRNRSRPVIAGVGVDFADYDWISNNTDTVDTAHAGFKATLIQKRLDWTANASFSTATGRIETRNPVAPVSGPAPNNASAKAKPMPAFEDNLIRVETALQYHFWKSWTASLNYVFESFDKHDWRTDGLDPFIPGVSSIFLGNDQKNYTAHIIGATLRYKFE